MVLYRPQERQHDALFLEKRLVVHLIPFQVAFLPIVSRCATIPLFFTFFSNRSQEWSGRICCIQLTKKIEELAGCRSLYNVAKVGSRFQVNE